MHILKKLAVIAVLSVTTIACGSTQTSPNLQQVWSEAPADTQDAVCEGLRYYGEQWLRDTITLRGSQDESLSYEDGRGLSDIIISRCGRTND
jgi:hypothetical protein